MALPYQMQQTISPGANWMPNQTGVGAQALQVSQAAQQEDEQSRIKATLRAKNPGISEDALNRLVAKSMGGGNVPGPSLNQYPGIEKILKLRDEPIVPWGSTSPSPAGALPSVASQPPGALPADYVQRRAAQQAAVDADRARMPPNAGPQIAVPNRAPGVSRMSSPAADVDPREAMFAQMTADSLRNQTERENLTNSKKPTDFAGDWVRSMRTIPKPEEGDMRGSALSRAMIDLGANALGNNPQTGGRTGFAGALPKFASTLTSEVDKGTARNRQTFLDSIQEQVQRLVMAGMDEKSVEAIFSEKLKNLGLKHAEAQKILEGKVGAATEDAKLKNAKDVAGIHAGGTLAAASLHDPIRIAREFAKDPAVASVYAGTMHPKAPDNTLEHAADKASLADYAAKFEAAQQPLPPREVLIGLVKGSYKLKQTADKKLAVVDAAGNPVK